MVSTGSHFGNGYISEASLSIFSESNALSLTQETTLNKYQRTNVPVNAHLRSAILTKYLFKTFALNGAPPTNQNKGLGQKSTKL